MCGFLLQTIYSSQLLEINTTTRLGLKLFPCKIERPHKSPNNIYKKLYQG
jgi:hypothetical protein